MSPSPEAILEALRWRYATKVFDPAKKISREQWAALEESLVLTPSSFGLQPWEFVVVEDPEVRESLVKHTWSQRQVADASHLLVIATRTDVDVAHVDRFFARVEEVRGEPGSSGYRDTMAGFVGGLDPAEAVHWGKLQAYLALGQFMTVAAMMGIDTCPMEGFVAERYDEVLGFGDRNLTTAVLCPAGYRSEEDKYARLPKVRFEPEDLVTHQ